MPGQDVLLKKAEIDAALRNLIDTAMIRLLDDDVSIDRDGGVEWKSSTGWLTSHVTWFTRGHGDGQTRVVRIGVTNATNPRQFAGMPAYFRNGKFYAKRFRKDGTIEFRGNEAEEFLAGLVQCDLDESAY